MTVRWNIAERVEDRYIKHEAASTTAPMTNGWPLDSGSAMLLSSNLAHLCRESCRNLVQSPGLGTAKVPSFTTGNAVFDGLHDLGLLPADNTAFTNFGGASEIPWDPRTAESFPAHLICDRQNDDGRITLRSIRFLMDATIDTNCTSYVYHFAITNHSDPGRLMGGDYLAHSSDTFGGTGNKTAVATLSSTQPWHPNMLTQWPCRPADYVDGATSVLILEAYLWFGWG